MYEFYSWNHDYGNNLSPDAPIKVPGMTYVPPIIGTKTLLSIEASSYPSWGTLFMVLAFAAAVAALVLRLRRPPSAVPETRTAPIGKPVSMAAAVLLMIVISACGQVSGGERYAAEKQAAKFAADGGTCAYCDGEIPEERFGGELVTLSGETYRFMSVECLAGFVASGRVDPDRIRSLRVVDYNDGERLIDAETALYVRSEQRKSPNGLNLLASDSEKIAHNLHFFFGGERMSWPQVLDLVRKEWEL
jgi:copper chaperone NosL